VGAGMTGGVVYLYGDHTDHINPKYIAEAEIGEDESLELQKLLQDYAEKTGSIRVNSILNEWSELRHGFRKYLPIKELQKQVRESMSDSDHQAA
jgi:glutamate synthase domain-containing protein 3